MAKQCEDDRLGIYGYCNFGFCGDVFFPNVNIKRYCSVVVNDSLVTLKFKRHGRPKRHSRINNIFSER